jgi:hypothetical protein
MCCKNASHVLSYLIKKLKQLNTLCIQNCFLFPYLSLSLSFQEENQRKKLIFQKIKLDKGYYIHKIAHPDMSWLFEKPTPLELYDRIQVRQYRANFWRHFPSTVNDNSRKNHPNWSKKQFQPGKKNVSAKRAIILRKYIFCEMWYSLENA